MKTNLNGLKDIRNPSFKRSLSPFYQLPHDRKNNVQSKNTLDIAYSQIADNLDLVSPITSKEQLPLMLNNKE